MLRLLSKRFLIVTLLGVILLIYFGYFIARDNEIVFLTTFLAFCSLFFYIFPFWKKKKLFKLTFTEIFSVAIVFRITLLFMVPNLSDDYFRFVWDGNLLANGNNPYAYKPVEQPFFYEKSEITLKERAFYGANPNFPSGMNSKEYYSVYPPVNQAIFGVSSYFSGNNTYINIILLRLIIIGFDIGVMLLLAKLLKWFSKKKELIVIYALNPLVIIELTGNLHFEGVTLFFVLSAIWFLLQKRTIQAGLFYALAICTKLIPIMLLPFFIFRLKWKQLLLFYGVIGIFTLLLFLPFTDVNLFQTFGESIGLYFKNFEFNASFYYIFREIGYQIYGYNKIELIGKIGQGIVLVSAVILLIKSRKKTGLKQIFDYLIWVLLIYYAVASIVHPWYVIYLLGFSVFTNLKFPLVWSFTVVLSYFTYREIGEVHESFLFITIEYLILLAAVVWDIVVPYRNIK